MTAACHPALDARTPTPLSARPLPCGRVLACLTASVLLGSAARPEPLAAQEAATAHTFALNWVRAPGAEACLPSVELARRIEQILGPVFRAPDSADRALEGLVAPTPQGNGFSVSIRVLDAAGSVLGERSFARDANTCDELSNSILLVVALTIDPTSAERGLPAELLHLLEHDQDPGAALLAELARERAERQVIESADPSPGSVEPSPPRANAPDPPRRVTRSTRARAAAPEVDASGVHVELAIAPALSIGVQPELAPGAIVGVRLVTPWSLAFELGAMSWLPSGVELPHPQSGTVDFHALAASAMACLLPFDDAKLRAAACAGATLGSRWVRSDALYGAAASHTFAGAVAAFDVRYALTHTWFALASLSVLGLFARDSFYFTDASQRAERLFTPSAVGAWLALGVGVRI